MTRDTVPRPTPARAATCSMVGWPPEPSRRTLTDDLDRVAQSRGTSFAHGRKYASAMPAEQIGVPLCAGFRGPLQGLVVDVDDPESLRVPASPLEVVEQ